MSAANYSLTTFAANGKLAQIDFALNAVGAGKTSLGIKATNGVVIATEKKMPSTLADETSLQKIQQLSENIGVIYAGMGPDFRVLVHKGRKAAQSYWLTYHEPIPVSQMVREIAEVMQEFTQSGGVRPFGVSLLVAGVDDDGPQLYQVDPSGSFWAWKASAIGSNSTSAKTFLEKRYLISEPGLEDAIQIGLLTLKEGFGGALDESNIEVGVVDVTTKKFRILKPAELKEYLQENE